MEVLDRSAAWRLKSSRTASSCRRHRAARSTAPRSKTCCSCGTRWRIWLGPSNALSRARSRSRLNATKRPTQCRLLLLAIRRTQTCRDICCHRKCRLTGFHCCRYNCKIPCTRILPARSFRGLNAAPSCSPTPREKSTTQRPAKYCYPSRTFCSMTRSPARRRPYHSAAPTGARAGRRDVPLDVVPESSRPGRRREQFAVRSTAGAAWQYRGTVDTRGIAGVRRESNDDDWIEMR
jgi:hypothetical protein